MNIQEYLRPPTGTISLGDVVFDVSELSDHDRTLVSVRTLYDEVEEVEGPKSKLRHAFTLMYLDKIIGNTGLVALGVSTLAKGGYQAFSNFISDGTLWNGISEDACNVHADNYWDCIDAQKLEPSPTDLRIHLAGGAALLLTAGYFIAKRHLLPVDRGQRGS